MEAGTPDLVKLEDLRLPGQLSGRNHVLSIQVENKPGVLAQVAAAHMRMEAGNHVGKIVLAVNHG